MLFLSSALFAQKDSLLTIKAEAYSVMLYEPDSQTWSDWSEWTALSSVIIKLDSKAYFITISNDANDKFKILKVLAVTEGVDEDGDGFENYSFNAVNKEGNLLDLRFKLFDSGVIHLYCEYPKIIYVYSGNRIEF